MRSKIKKDVTDFHILAPYALMLRVETFTVQHLRVHQNKHLHSNLYYFHCQVIYLQRVGCSLLRHILLFQGMDAIHY